MTILFSVGNGLDEPTVVHDLLDITKTPGRPGYKIADPEPLVFSHAEFNPCPFRNSQGSHQESRSAALTVFGENLEKSLARSFHLRAGLSTILPADNSFFDYRLKKAPKHSLLKIIPGRPVAEKVASLKGNKKQRFDSVQKWKDRVMGEDRQRTRSRSAEKRREKEKELQQKILKEKEERVEKGLKDQKENKEKGGDESGEKPKNCQEDLNGQQVQGESK